VILLLQKYARLLVFEFSNHLAVTMLFNFHKGRLSIYSTSMARSPTRLMTRNAIAVAAVVAQHLEVVVTVMLLGTLMKMPLVLLKEKTIVLGTSLLFLVC
jgi:hypothetical protein